MILPNDKTYYHGYVPRSGSTASEKQYYITDSLEYAAGVYGKTLMNENEAMGSRLLPFMFCNVTVLDVKENVNVLDLNDPDDYRWALDNLGWPDSTLALMKTKDWLDVLDMDQRNVIISKIRKSKIYQGFANYEMDGHCYSICLFSKRNSCKEMADWGRAQLVRLMKRRYPDKQEQQKELALEWLGEAYHKLDRFYKGMKAITANAVVNTMLKMKKTESFLSLSTLERSDLQALAEDLIVTLQILDKPEKDKA